MTPATDSIRRREHPGCLLCGTENPLGFRLRFRPTDDEGVVAETPLAAHLQGFTGRLHGGVTAALLDAAMANCCFTLGVVAVTVRMELRYLRPIPVRGTVLIRARRVAATPPLHRLVASVEVDGTEAARAEATFAELAWADETATKRGANA